MKAPTLCLALSVLGLVACGDAQTREFMALDRLAVAAPTGVLHIRPPETDSLPAPYPGRAIDSSLYGPFRARYPELSGIKDTNALSVIYKLPLTKGRTAFVLRVPSQYSSSAADLWVYNHARRSWEMPVHLADSFGDGCWYFFEDAWILDLDGDGRLDIVRRRRDTWVDDDSAARAGQSDSLWVQYSDSSGFRAPTFSADPNLRRRFDIPGWKPLTDKSC